MSKLILTLDSSQISQWLECNRLWDYGSNQNLCLQVKEPNDAMMMGSYMHKLLEIYYVERCKGSNGVTSIAAAKAWNPDTETCECGHAVDQHMVTDDGVYFCKPECKCLQFNSVPYPLDAVKRKDVVSRFEIYCYTYANNDFSVNDTRKVEVGFSTSLYESYDRIYILEGRIDLFDVDSPASHLDFVDHKSQLQRRDLYEKSVQFRNYAWAVKAKMGMINYIRFAKNVDQYTFQRKLLTFSAAEHAWWEQELIKIYDDVARSIRDDTFTPNWAACQGRFNTKCAFTSLCEEINPSVRDARKEQLYTIKEAWRPW